MKKYLNLLFIILIPLIICACEDNGKREGKLIEISALELTRNFHGENSKDFIFATVNEHKKGYEEFLESLKKLVKETNQTIYYVYYQHIDTEASLYIFNLYDAYFTSNAYHVVEDSEMLITEEYKSYDKMKTDLKGIYYKDKLTMQSEKEVKENLKYAKEEYDKGNISVAFNYLNRIYDEPEAKNFFKENKYLGIVKVWEHFIITKGKKDKITYRSLMFLHDSISYYETLIKDDYETFEEPTYLNGYDQFFYYVKDDIIYTSTTQDGKYEKRYLIKEIEETRLSLIDYKYKKDYIFKRKV